MHRVRMLQHFGVTPYLVFDGDRLPGKAGTEEERRKKRDQSRRTAIDLHNLGKVSKAYDEFRKAVDVTPEMARQLIDELKRCDVQFVVAPYEADAQLAYLERLGTISGVISEDSDLLVFGSSCLLTKLDQYGECIEISRKDFTACREINLAGWSNDEFRMMAILSGCDYLPNINKIGLMKAHRLVRKHKTIESIVRNLQFDGQITVPPGYLEAFRKADQTFLHQRVFCPESQRVVMFTESQQPLDKPALDSIGLDVPANIAIGVSKGDLHPATKKPLKPRSEPTSNSRPAFGRSRSVLVEKSQPFEDLKGNKSINTFFKSTRVPLAELDPNSLLPSPRQQAILERNAGVSWASSPIPVPSTRRSVTDPSGLNNRTPLTAPPLGRTIGSRRDFNTRPIKRPRLCDENNEPDKLDSTQGEGSTSRFFATSSVSLKGLGSKSTPSRKGRKINLTIYSDDSIEDSLQNVPLTSDTCNKAPEKEDPIEKCKKAQDKKTVSSITKTHSVNELEAIRKKYTFKPDTIDSTQAIQVAKLSTTDTNRLALASKAINTKTHSSKVETNKKPLTPLQRMGITAINRIRPGDSLEPKQTGSTLPKAIDDLVPLDFEGSSLPLPKPRVAAPGVGSEDLIIPNSEEDEVSSPIATPSLSYGKGGFDLSHFVFKGLA
ncbi:MAG: Rad2 nuclease [Vezdaea aestivalis]|nr:MAG: Rad2 nuclease [Vezdaea aestivalis]